jgi:hypothetical protein
MTFRLGVARDVGNHVEEADDRASVSRYDGAGTSLDRFRRWIGHNMPTCAQTLVDPAQSIGICAAVLKARSGSNSAC